MPLRYSLLLFGVDPGEYAPLAQRAEAEGFDTVWLGEHVITPVGYRSSYPYGGQARSELGVGTPLVDLWVTIGHLAAATERIRLGTGILILPLRHPVATARSAATASALSGGRLVLGVGTGWLREEFEALAADFDARAALLDEGVAVIRALWRGEPAEHHGDLVDFGPVQLVPRPQHPLPIVFGGISAAAARRAALLGDGWLGPACPLEVAVRVRDQIRAARDDAFSFYPRVPDPFADGGIARFLEAGFDELVVSVGRVAGQDAPLAAKLDAVSRAADAFRAHSGG